MIFLEDGYIKGLSEKDIYIISRSLIDAWGYPYKPKKISILNNREEYKNMENKLEKNNKIELKDLNVVINSLELLYFENIDLEALYDDVSREEVKILLNGLKIINDSQKGNLIKQKGGAGLWTP